MTKPDDPQFSSARPDTDSGFTSVAQASRIIREFSGLLPATGHAARHILRCEHLRQLPGEGFPPFRAEPEYTHQLWFWYRLHQTPEQLILLFRGQFNLSIYPQPPDEAAYALTNRFSQQLVGMKDESYLYRRKDSETYWANVLSHLMHELQGEKIIYL